MWGGGSCLCATQGWDHGNCCWYCWRNQSTTAGAMSGFVVQFRSVAAGRRGTSGFGLW